MVVCELRHDVTCGEQEALVRIYCAKTGRFFRDVLLEDHGTGPASLYVQSLVRRAPPRPSRRTPQS